MVADRPIICIFGSVILSRVIRISSVGPLVGSFSRCISSIMSVLIVFIQGVLCLSRESSFSDVQNIMSLLCSCVSFWFLSLVAMPIFIRFWYFVLKSLYFSFASALSGVM